MNIKKIISYALHIIKNHILTTIIFIAFMYFYFTVFRNITAQLISGILISILYLYGNFSSARFFAKKKDAQSIQSAIISILIASVPTFLITFLAMANISFTNKWEIKHSWFNVIFRLWNSPFIGIFSYADDLTKKVQSSQPIIFTYIMATLYLPVSSIIGYLIGHLESLKIIKLPEFSIISSTNKRQKNKPNKTGKTY